MSKRSWVRHSICISCWVDQRGAGRLAGDEKQLGAPEVCCFCDGAHASGIYVRGEWNQAGTVCQGACDV